ncbi:hypothetical protein BS78_K206300 [Paspalum vaginatum]|uniref:Uncharacterized protein n=1 Tax=Paspalum vaginatum TaxID=158149 RepID=A0A9W7XEL7_9POAL|nr:hypothetical protein BS78_K206300 [Paspalum vaginatum]
MPCRPAAPAPKPNPAIPAILHTSPAIPAVPCARAQHPRPLLRPRSQCSTKSQPGRVRQPPTPLATAAPAGPQLCPDSPCATAAVDTRNHPCPVSACRAAIPLTSPRPRPLVVLPLTSAFAAPARLPPCQEVEGAHHLLSPHRVPLLASDSGCVVTAPAREVQQGA